jgi:hypothetical protein
MLLPRLAWLSGYNSIAVSLLESHLMGREDNRDQEGARGDARAGFKLIALHASKKSHELEPVI